LFLVEAPASKKMKLRASAEDAEVPEPVKPAAAPITLEAAILAAKQADADVVATAAAEQAASDKLDADRRETAAAKALFDAERKKQGGLARMSGNPGGFGHESFPPRCPYSIASEAAKEKAVAAHALVESLEAEKAANAAVNATKAAARRAGAFVPARRMCVHHGENCVCAPDVSNMPAAKPAAKPRPIKIKTMYTIRKKSTNAVPSYVKYFAEYDDDFLLEDTDKEEEDELAAIVLQEDKAAEESMIQLYTPPVKDKDPTPTDEQFQAEIRASTQRLAQYHKDNGGFQDPSPNDAPVTDADFEEDSGSDTDDGDAEDTDDGDEEDKPGFNWEKPFYFRRDGDKPAFSTLLGVLEGPQEKPDDWVLADQNA
jgi:hypothetical protein